MNVNLEMAFSFFLFLNLNFRVVLVEPEDEDVWPRRGAVRFIIPHITISHPTLAQIPSMSLLLEFLPAYHVYLFPPPSFCSS